jgi:MFS family permease
LISTFFATAFLDKLGRKIILVSSFVLMFLGLAGIGSFFIIKDLGTDTSNIQWLPLVSLCVFTSAFNFGIAPVTCTILGEIFKTEAKKFVAPMGLMVDSFLTFVLGFTFPMLVDAIGLGYTFYIFAIISFFGIFYSIFFIPETKGKSFKKIIEMLK